MEHRTQRPPWLNKKISLGDCTEVKSVLRDMRLNTVCEEAACPNIGECFSRRQATVIILGSVCTRGCRFCAVKKGTPEPPDTAEASRIAEAIKKLNLLHVVVTSVTRDDLIDGGASFFAEAVHSIRKLNPSVKIETLVPDFQENKEALRTLTKSAPDIISHNVETVPRLYEDIRSGASYQRSLRVLKISKDIAPDIPTKSGLMLGLGESENEVLSVMDDLVNAGCSFLSIGQYLAPSNTHTQVREYVPPERFEWYNKEALNRGFRSVMSGPYVRSSYYETEFYNRDNRRA
ncbi:MAG: lipoyl synthase [Candidatus Omnitrophica bacterium]|nr:lipoyl synthase [Candidatus Omnitrophota bacterium]